MYPIHVAVLFNRMESYSSVDFFLFQVASECIVTTGIMIENSLHLKISDNNININMPNCALIMLYVKHKHKIR